MRRSRASRSDHRGASLVEFALIAPLLFLLLFGIVDFARYVGAWESVRSSAREGARFATAIGNTVVNDIPHYVDCDEIKGAAAAGGGVIDVTTSDVTVTYDTGPPPLGAVKPFDCQLGDPPIKTDIDSGDRVIVTVTVQFTVITPIISNFVGGSVTLTSVDRRTVFKP